MEEPFLIIYNYFFYTLINAVEDDVEGMFNQRNHFILEYTCNLLICRTCLFPLVAVPPQSYLVLISKYIIQTVFFILQE